MVLHIHSGMDEIISALENIAGELENCYEGRLKVNSCVPVSGMYPQISSVLTRIAYLEEQKPAKFLGFIPYKKRKTLVSVCETWFFGKETTRRVSVQCPELLAEDAVRKHLAEYI